MNIGESCATRLKEAPKKVTSNFNTMPMGQKLEALVSEAPEGPVIWGLLMLVCRGP